MIQKIIVTREFYSETKNLVRYEIADKLLAIIPRSWEDVYGPRTANRIKLGLIQEGRVFFFTFNNISLQKTYNPPQPFEMIEPLLSQ